MSDQSERGEVMGGPKTWTEQEIREVLEELRDAAGMAYSELVGTEMHRKGHLRLANMVEPNRKAYCVLKNREYIPPLNPS